MEKADLCMVDASGKLVVHWDSVAAAISVKFVEYVKNYISRYDIEVLDVYLSSFSSSDASFFYVLAPHSLHCFQKVGDYESHYMLMASELTNMREKGWF